MQIHYMDNLMPLHFLWSEVERLMEVRGIAHRDELAKLTGIHRTNLHKISKGANNPSFAAISKLCQALRCQPGDLLQFVYEDEDEEAPQDNPSI